MLMEFTEKSAFNSLEVQSCWTVNVARKNFTNTVKINRPVMHPTTCRFLELLL